MLNYISEFFTWLGKSCYDDLPLECYEPNHVCSCQSFQLPVMLFMVVGIALGILVVLRLVGISSDDRQVVNK